MKVRIGVLSMWIAFAGCAHTVSPPTNEPAPPLTEEQLLAIATAAERLGDRLRAQQYLLAARRAGADPDQVTPRLIRLYVADGQYRLAIDCARDQLQSRPHHTGLRFILARLYEATQLQAAAVAEYERVLADEPEDPRPHLALARLLSRSGKDPSGVDRHYRAYLALRPDSPEAAEARASLMKEMP